VRPDRNFFRNYSDFRRILVYILFFLSVVLVVIPGLIAQLIQIAAIILLGWFILQILFEIFNRLTVLERPQQYDNFYSAWPDIKDCIMNAFKKGSPCTIWWLESSLEHASVMVDDVLKPILQNSPKNPLKIELVMLDPSWSEIEKINPSWISLAKSNYESLHVYLDVYNEEIRNHEWSIALSLYRFLPNFQGILVNSEHLFVSSCTWKNGKLTDDNFYELYHFNDNFGGKEKIDQFKSWFEHCRKENQNLTQPKPSNQGVTFYITSEDKKK
jgi:hypothetical protein